MYVVLTTIYDNSRFRISDWLGIGGSINDELWVAIIAMVHLLGLVWAFVQLRADGRERLADEFAEAGVIDDAEREVFLPIPEPARENGAVGGLAGSAVVYRAEEEPGRDDAELRQPSPLWSPGAILGESAVGLWLRERFGPRPIVPDRSAALAREGGGRFDKLDLWLLVVLVVATLVLRTFRLAEPLNMHFDEVYHARTATEFLQDWRYGDESNIYEWTHPHLGKYLIAAGITAFGDDRVSATGSIDAPVNDALVEPRHTDIATGDQTGAGCGSRRTQGSAVTTSIARRGRAIRPGCRRALAHDPTASQLFAATETGELYTLDLAQLDIGGAESVEPYQVADLGVPVDRLAIAQDGTTVSATAGDRLLVVDSVTGEVTLDTERPGLVEAADVGSGSAVVASPASIDDPPRSPSGWPSCSAGTPPSWRRNSRPARSASRSAGSATASRRTSRTRSTRASCRASRSCRSSRSWSPTGTGSPSSTAPPATSCGPSRSTAAPTASPDHRHRRREVLRDGGHRGQTDVRRGRPRAGRRGQGPAHRQLVPAARPRQPHRLRRADAPGAHPRPDAGRERVHGLRRRAARQRRLRRRPPPVRAVGVGLRHRRGASEAATASSSLRSPRTGAEPRSRSVSTRSAGGCPA